MPTFLVLPARHSQWPDLEQMGARDRCVAQKERIAMVYETWGQRRRLVSRRARFWQEELMQWLPGLMTKESHGYWNSRIGEAAKHPCSCWMSSWSSHSCLASEWTHLISADLDARSKRRPTSWATLRKRRWSLSGMSAFMTRYGGWFPGTSYSAHPPLKGKQLAVPAEEWTEAMMRDRGPEGDYLTRSTAAYPAPLNRQLAQTLVEKCKLNLGAKPDKDQREQGNTKVASNLEAPPHGLQELREMDESNGLRNIHRWISPRMKYIGKQVQNAIANKMHEPAGLSLARICAGYNFFLSPAQIWERTVQHDSMLPYFLSPVQNEAQRCLGPEDWPQLYSIHFCISFVLTAQVCR